MVGRKRLGGALSQAMAALLLAAGLSFTAAVPASATDDGEVTLMSHVPGSPLTTATGNDAWPTASSADGSFVLLYSNATNLVAGQSGPNNDNVYLYERATGVVRLVSHAAGGSSTTAAGYSAPGVISADGAWVTFASTATDLVAGQNDTNTVPGTSDTLTPLDVFLYERATGVVTLVSHIPTSATTTANRYSNAPAISADGAFVVFQSVATNLVAGQVDTNDVLDTFLFERATGAVRLVSHVPNSPTTAVDGGARPGKPSISDDGAFVSFESESANVVAGQDESGQSTALGSNYDVFLWNRAADTSTLVSHVPSSATSTAATSSSNASLSGDGAYVSFSSAAQNLVTGQVDAANTGDLFLFQRATGTVTLVSHAPGSPTTAAGGGGGVISADGSSVAFNSSSRTLVPSQVDNNGDDVFLFDRPTGAVTLVSHVPGAPSTAGAGNASTVLPAVNRNGSFVLFMSEQTNLVPNQVDPVSFASLDVFLFERATGKVTLLSHQPGKPAEAAGGAFVFPLVISADATVVPFASRSRLVAGMVDASSGNREAYLFERFGRRDLAVFRPSDSTWYVRDKAPVPFGASGDIPVPCDYDGNGSTDIAVFRPSVGGWFIKDQPTVFFGLGSDVPVPADYDGDGDCDVSTFRPSVGGWFRVGVDPVFYGLDGDIPVPADYDGDGDDDIAVFRPSVGGWYRSGANTTFFGLTSDIPVPADYNGDGTADIGVFRPGVGGWYVNGQATSFLGLSGDVPVPADYDGNGTADRAVFRPPSGAWYVGAQAPAYFGIPGDRPLPLPSAIRQVFFP